MANTEIPLVVKTPVLCAASKSDKEIEEAAPRDNGQL
jgi:hypothetical protein